MMGAKAKEQLLGNLAVLAGYYMLGEVAAEITIRLSYHLVVLVEVATELVLAQILTQLLQRKGQATLAAGVVGELV